MVVAQGVLGVLAVVSELVLGPEELPLEVEEGEAEPQGAQGDQQEVRVALEAAASLPAESAERRPVL